MGLAVVTVDRGGLPVTDVSGISAGLPVSESPNGRGLAITKVTAGGLPVVFVVAGFSASSLGVPPTPEPTPRQSVPRVPLAPLEPAGFLVIVRSIFGAARRRLHLW
jgi:hypothetical protein